MRAPKPKRRICRLLVLASLVGGATLYRQYRLARAPGPGTNSGSPNRR